jgi:hypothetical protein
MAARRTTRRIAAWGTTLLTLGAAGLVGTAPSPALAASGGPPISLERTRSSVTTDSEDGLVYLDLGVYALAGSRAFEIRTYRPGYREHLTSFRAQPGADQQLPAGSVAEDFSGLAKFFRLTITRKSKVVSLTYQAFCANGFDPVRRRPDAPATSPYPTDCSANPYSLGEVWGLEAGYATPALDYPELKLKPGHYQATVEIAPAFRSLFGISDSAGTASVALTVTKGDDDDVRPPLRMASKRGVHVLRAGSAPEGKSTAPSGPLPDLRSLPAWGIDVSRGRYLEFSATVWNAGPSPLLVDGFRRENNENLMDAYQYFFDGAGHQVGYAPVGTMEWDGRKGHEHWHFTDFATYRLLNKHKKLVVRSQKEAFCLANTDAVDYTVPHADWKPDNTDLATACGDRGSIGVREVLEAGSGDTYVQTLPGQSFDLKGLKNGVYYIEVLANPAKRLNEASLTNNVAYRKVTISGRSGHRKVSVAKVGVIKEPPSDFDD